MLRNAPPAANPHATLLLIPFWGHDLSLSLVELRDQLGLKKSELLRALLEAEVRGDLTRRGSFRWSRGPRMAGGITSGSGYGWPDTVASRLR